MPDPATPLNHNENGWNTIYNDYYWLYGPSYLRVTREFTADIDMITQLGYPNRSPIGELIECQLTNG